MFITFFFLDNELKNVMQGLLEFILKVITKKRKYSRIFFMNVRSYNFDKIHKNHIILQII